MSIDRRDARRHTVTSHRVQALYEAFLHSDLLSQTKAKVKEEVNMRSHTVDLSRRTTSPGWFRVFSTVTRWTRVRSLYCQLPYLSICLSICPYVARLLDRSVCLLTYRSVHSATQRPHLFSIFVSSITQSTAHFHPYTHPSFYPPTIYQPSHPQPNTSIHP